MLSCVWLFAVLWTVAFLPGSSVHGIFQARILEVSMVPDLKQVSMRLRASQGAPVVKNLPANAGDAGDGGSVSGLGRTPGGGNGNPLQYPCLENPMDRGAWWATVHGAAESQTQLSERVCTDTTHTHTYTHSIRVNSWVQGKYKYKARFVPSKNLDSYWGKKTNNNKKHLTSPTVNN